MRDPATHIGRRADLTMDGEVPITLAPVAPDKRVRGRRLRWRQQALTLVVSTAAVTAAWFLSPTQSVRQATVPDDLILWLMVASNALYVVALFIGSVALGSLLIPPQGGPLLAFAMGGAVGLAAFSLAKGVLSSLNGPQLAFWLTVALIISAANWGPLLSTLRPRLHSGQALWRRALLGGAIGVVCTGWLWFLWFSSVTTPGLFESAVAFILLCLVVSGITNELTGSARLTWASLVAVSLMGLLPGFAGAGALAALIVISALTVIAFTFTRGRNRTSLVLRAAAGVLALGIGTALMYLDGTSVGTGQPGPYRWVWPDPAVLVLTITGTCSGICALVVLRARVAPAAQVPPTAVRTAAVALLFSAAITPLLVTKVFLGAPVSGDVTWFAGGVSVVALTIWAARYGPIQTEWPSSETQLSNRTTWNSALD